MVVVGPGLVVRGEPRGVRSRVGALTFPGGVRADGLPAAVAEAGRLAAVAATGLLDTGPEPTFDDLAALAAQITGCQRAFVTLVDARRSFWKASVGVSGEAAARRGTSVEESFCYLLIGLGEGLAVGDVAADPRTREHPSVRPMKIGAWAGQPILAPGGEVLGSLCVIDENPRVWAPQELSTLGTLARAVSNEINLRSALASARDAERTSAALARSLQDSLLPPVLDEIPTLQTAASYLPAAGGTTVVGDFYDLFRTTGRWWCAVMGDVCGKGVDAAKLTALARYTLRAEATQHRSPAAVCERLNSALLAYRGNDRFLTAVCVMLRPTADGVEGRLCLAGHPPPLVRRAAGAVAPVGEPGTLLGVLDDVHLVDTPFRLGPGDALLLYTDGATEARPRRRDQAAAAGVPMFGEEALEAAFARCEDLAATGVVASLGEELSRYSGDWASDDTALLVIRVPPA
ncbi:SpoIIE family protein phosphatase [Frankia sp. R82]|nr:SpoIIE family protein phosphatase [Frankia sp. R82]